MASLHSVAVHDPLENYRLIKEIDGDPREGASLVNAQRVGVFCDLRIRQSVYEPVSTYDELRSAVRLNACLDLLSLHRPMVHPFISFDIFDSAYVAPGGRIAMPTGSDSLAGVHCVWVTGYEDDGERLVFCNTWGASWGDAGSGSVSRAYLAKYMRDAWVYRDVRWGWSPFNHRMKRATTAGELRAAWQVETPRFRAWHNHRGEPVRLCLYAAWSAVSRSAIEVIELRSPLGFRLAWAFVFHLGDRTSLIKELFVWPWYRRHGYGSLLERLALERAAKRHSDRLGIYLHAADALISNRAASREFGLSSGYQWAWRNQSLPNLAAIGWKAV